jgi:hypothetical protein
VSRAQGVRSHPVGQIAAFVLDVAHALYFDGAGRRIVG